MFTHFANGSGWGSKVYVLMLGLLLAQYTFTGYDASAHMTEETRDAAVAGPRGIVTSIIVSLLAGWVLLIGVTFAIQNYSGEVGATVPPAQIFIDAIGGTGAKLLLLIVIVAQLFCGMSSVTANSRMIYAFSRDGAVPGSRIWHHINAKTRTPTNAIWLAAGGALILGLPYLWNSTAYAAVTSIAVIGLYVAYVLPTFLRLRLGSAFQRGPWHLGRWSRPIGIIACVWVVVHHGAVHAPDREPDQLRQLQLHRVRGGRRDRLRRHLLARLRPQVVHRPPGTGLGRGTAGDRGGAREHLTANRQYSALAPASVPAVIAAAGTDAASARPTPTQGDGG